MLGLDARSEPRGEAAPTEPTLGAEVRPAELLLVGNPNVGKSVLFRNLTGRYVTVSNFPGTTVDVVRGRAAFADEPLEVVDTPGLNDLSAGTEDALVTRRLLETADDAVLVQVADAKNLRRALLLTLQLAALGRPMVLVLNMMDELAARGSKIDLDGLAGRLGVPVVAMVAVRGDGTGALARALPRARAPRLAQPEIDAAPDEYRRNLLRLRRVDRILGEVCSSAQPPRASLGVRLGFWAMHPVKGIAVLAAVLLIMFWFVGLFGAGTLVDLLEVGVFEQRLNPLAIRALDAALPFPHEHPVVPSAHTVALPVSPVHELPLVELDRAAPGTGYALTGELTGTGRALRFVHDLMVGEYGVFTMAVSYALAIVLPIVTTFFLLFSLLEDSGYLPRMAILLNRLFKRFGLNGKAVLPMILGLGCDTVATLSTRILETRKERIVTTVLLALAVPCSAQLGVLLAMMARLSLPGALAWAALVAAIFVVVGRLAARLVPGPTSEFLLEIPPLRLPQAANVATKTIARLDWYLREIIPLFVLGTAVLFLLDRSGLLARIRQLGEPVVVGWLGLPAETANAFLVGFLRRDFGAVYLLDAATGPAPALSPLQVFVAMVTITLFMPCFANFLMIAKEHGKRVAWAITAFIFPFAFLVGGLALRVGRWLTGV